MCVNKLGWIIKSVQIIILFNNEISLDYFRNISS